MFINKIKLLLAGLLLLTKNLLTTAFEFCKEKEVVIGKWLCKRYGNWEDFLQSYTPKRNSFLKQSVACSYWHEIHVPYRMVFTNKEYTFSFVEAQPDRMNPLTKALWKIPGVTKIELRAYQITIQLADFFDIKEIESQLLYAAEKYAPKIKL